MRASLLEILVDPVTGDELVLHDEEREGDEILRGTLSGAGVYAVVDAIPRFVVTADPGQRQTESSFAYKWTNREGFGSEGMQRVVADWLVDRYGFGSRREMRDFFGSRRRVLDAGCGAGLATSAWMDPSWSRDGAEWVGVDISAAIDVARARLAQFPNTHFVQSDILQLPFREGVFDAIISEGVLHHTPSTERAFRSLARLLAPGGELMIYVYRRKAPVREFADDYIRELLQGMQPEEAWAALRPLTRLAQALSELHVEVDVPEDVPLLGISAGKHDVQRLLYWHFAKLYWNDQMTFEENNHVNFDWYAPRYAHRHTADEVRGWYAASDLEIVHFDEQESGFTVRGLRRA